MINYSHTGKPTSPAGGCIGGVPSGKKLKTKNIRMNTACFALAIIIFPFACRFTKNDSKAVSGTYVRVADSELNTLYDTVIFSPVNDKSTERYHISQRSGTHFKKKEDQGFNKKSSRTITGTYDQDNHVMHTPDPGLLYSFDLENSTVTINGIEYHKIQ